MMELREVTIPVDSTWRRADFMRAVEQVIRLGRVQSLHIDMMGISYSHMVETDEIVPVLQMALDKENPYSIIRNAAAQEVLVQGLDPLAALATLFQEVALERMHPLMFVTGGNTDLWKWVQKSVALRPMDVLMGLPVTRDRAVDDNTLFLCAGFAQDDSLHETKKSFKILMET